MKSIKKLGSLSFVLGLFTVFFVGLPWYIVTSEDVNLPVWMKAAILCLIGGIFLVLVGVSLEQSRKGASDAEFPLEETQHDMLILNSETIPDTEISEILGVAKGHTIFAIWIGNDLSAIIRLVLGGELTEYTEMMGKARNIATERMIEQAEALGADAIINVRYMTTSVIGSAAELLAYGTAVKIKK